MSLYKPVRPLRFLLDSTNVAYRIVDTYGEHAPRVFPLSVNGFMDAEQALCEANNHEVRSRPRFQRNRHIMGGK